MLFSHFFRFFAVLGRFFAILGLLGSLLFLLSCKNPFANSIDDQSVSENDYLITISERGELAEEQSDDEDNDIFVDFPSAFDEKNVLPLDEEENRALVLENKLNKKKEEPREVVTPPEKLEERKRVPNKVVKRTVKQKKSVDRRPGLSYIRKLYYGKQYSKLARMSFTENELDQLFF